MRFPLALIVLLGIVVSACNDGASVKIKEEDSAKNRVERIGKEVDSSAEKLKDSARNKSEEIRKKVEDRVEGKDTTSN